ncbi:MAG: hypothetical protein EBZ75_14085, partial [Oxalobacteraceae bacterium]|nr:hypothetical protein [Oxalobacteraceae bacterium]
MTSIRDEADADAPAHLKRHAMAPSVAAGEVQPSATAQAPAAQPIDAHEIDESSGAPAPVEASATVQTVSRTAVPLSRLQHITQSFVDDTVSSLPLVGASRPRVIRVYDATYDVTNASVLLQPTKEDKPNALCVDTFLDTLLADDTYVLGAQTFT